uniref:CSON004200 protein n=1 Tax=Culicoides sonorensis TaxID=179676 RepID=A0A336MP44_CULSO
MTDFSDNCRCCLEDVSCLEISKYFSLDDQIQSDSAQNSTLPSEFDGKSYRTVFEEYAGFKVLPGEPDNLCVNCKTRLLDGWKFWKLLRKTQNVLQEALLKENEEVAAIPPLQPICDTVEDTTAVDNEVRKLAEETKDILAYLAADLNISDECKNIDTLPPLTLDLDLDALIDGQSIPLHLGDITGSPKKQICPFSPNKAYKNIDMHLSRKHRELKTIKCTTMGCRRTFYTTEMLAEHLLKDCGRRPSVIRKENEREFTCKFCGRKFDHYQKVRSHENGHRTRIKAAKEGPRYKCDICQRYFMEKKNVKSHIESVHLRIQKLHCKECNLKFYSGSGFRYHKNSVHKNRKTFKCQFCDYETKVKLLLNRHLKRHDNPKGYLKVTKQNDNTVIKNNNQSEIEHELSICLKKIKTNQHLQKLNGSSVILCEMPKKPKKVHASNKHEIFANDANVMDMIQEQGEILAEINHCSPGQLYC